MTSHRPFTSAAPPVNVAVRWGSEQHPLTKFRLRSVLSNKYFFLPP